MASEGAKLRECSGKIGVNVCTIRAGHALSRAAIQSSRTHAVPWKSGASAPRQALLENPGFSPRGISSSRNPGLADENGYAAASRANLARTGFKRTYSQCL
jgi:hypothetical protein